MAMAAFLSLQFSHSTNTLPQLRRGSYKPLHIPTSLTLSRNISRFHPILQLNVQAALLLRSDGQSCYSIKGSGKENVGDDEIFDPNSDKEELGHKLIPQDEQKIFEGWDVPWDGGVLFSGMFLWVLSFLSTGLAVSMMSVYLGYGRRQMMDFDDQAIYLLIGQSLQTIMGLTSIAIVVKNYDPFSSDLFIYDWKRPFDIRRGWLLWGGIGVLCSGAAVALASTITAALTSQPQAREEADALVQLLPLIGASPISTASLIAVTGVLAPVLEETVFRGFLLTSLTKWFPVPAAVFLSASAFALAHLTPGEFPQLFALGLVMGFAYAQTHNLLTPILIHSIWNSGVVIVLTLLRLQGYHIEDVI